MINNIKAVSNTEVLPRISNFEITNICNMNCPICVEKSKIQGCLSIELLHNILSNNPEYFYGRPLWLHLRGEPYINKDLYDIIDIFDKFNVPTMLSTNGILLNDDNIYKTITSKLEIIVISSLTLDRDKYYALRGKDCLVKVQRNIDNMVNTVRKYKSNLKVTIVGLDYGQERKEINDFIRFYHLKGLEVAIHKYTDRTGMSQFNPTQTLNNITKRRKSCHLLFNKLIIQYDGSVTTCCYDLTGQNTMGFLQDYGYSIKELWNGENYMNIRKDQCEGIFQNACKNCKDWVYGNPKYSRSFYSNVKIYPLNDKPYYV